ncbi:two-component system OmpR family response regulator [Chitinivorax tropicus]|uniref:Two-component system OmpR family response regulator n=1 Tax=Chitinivorax tropicus TaxID=714531 RepID=A0A840MLT9_9PROT|nr:response regulator transcription factor [Chitinivorax tropicus]MBB5017163.1 two-component system OmpR family response regulator [Chitinivorax tropicus]
MRLFLAEDDEILADALKAGLSRKGFEVEHCADGAEAERLLINREYAAAILDIGLPSVDGLTVLRRVRMLKPTVPILLLTALDGLDNRVAGLDAGADDYLTKPFEFIELEARLRAILRRSHLLPPSAQQLGPLKLDRAAQRAWCDNVPLDLSARELAVLDVLISQRDRVVTKEQIATEFGSGASEVGANAVEVYVHRLRKKLEPYQVGIRTVRGLGYLLEVEHGED